MYNGMIAYKPQRIRTPIISAAGLGIEFLPITKACPKEIPLVVDKPIIQYVIKEALEISINDICIITGFNKRVVEIILTAYMN